MNHYLEKQNGDVAPEFLSLRLRTRSFNFGKVKAYNWNHKKYRYFAINTGSSISIFITYILFLTKMQKGKPGEMDLPLLKNSITTNWTVAEMADI